VDPDPAVVVFVPNFSPGNVPVDLVQSFAQPAFAILCFCSKAMALSRVGKNCKPRPCVWHFQHGGAFWDSSIRRNCTALYTSADVMLLPSQYDAFRSRRKQAICVVLRGGLQPRVGADDDLSPPLVRPLYIRVEIGRPDTLLASHSF